MLRKLASLFIAMRLYIVAAPYALMVSGAAMNQAAIIANNSAMPVYVNDKQAEMFGFDKNGWQDPIHVRMTDESRLKWLCDIINLKAEIDSLGDLFIDFGALLNKYAMVVWATLICTDLGAARLAKKRADERW